ncbi:LicD family protein (phosphorylcholine metabolism) (plasmid) [Legionella adelaidensis]|uniref:LicD family protein (Phosphorylcholine metabolism) n=1 Tax=Legionella adelaidensis TaxID=45056 RepID=A0A0W0R1W2_9GAMM|nr:LicD family protein [Legionella adelaidensis]KTC65089.1 LicD family protein (phosphorylcholine metabolism) [Legionella adelaidensis]VEH85391.1 LicD family protein (phosphorylcholine metabolism) [Legionella adelaidensis]
MEKLESGSNLPVAITNDLLRAAQLKMLSMLKVIDAICKEHDIDYWLDAGTLLGSIRHQGFIPWDDDMDIAMPRKSYEKFLQVAPKELPAHMYLQKAGGEKGYYNLGTPLKVRDKKSYYLEKYERGNETYTQGIFIDVFVYDKMPAHPLIHKSMKRISRKLLRILGTKYSSLPMGRSHQLYKTLGYFFPKIFLNKCLDLMVHYANKQNTPYLGRGYHCKKVTHIKFEEVYPLRKGEFEGESFNIPNKAEFILRKEYGDYLTLPPESERTLRHCKTLIMKQ